MLCVELLFGALHVRKSEQTFHHFDEMHVLSVKSNSPQSMKEVVNLHNCIESKETHFGCWSSNSDRAVLWCILEGFRRYFHRFRRYLA